MNKVDTAIEKELWTNRTAFIGGLDVCQWNPERDVLAKLADPFHGEAVAESSMKGVGKLRVCDSCAIRLARINGGGK